MRPNTYADAPCAAAQPDSMDMAKLLVFFAGDRFSPFSHIKFSMLELGESLGRMNDGLARMLATLSHMGGFAADMRIVSWIAETGRSGEELASLSGGHVSLLLDAVHHYQESRDSSAQANIAVMHSIIEQTILKFKIANSCIDNVNYTLSLLGDAADPAAAGEKLLAVRDRMQAVSAAFQLFHEWGRSANQGRGTS